MTKQNPHLIVPENTKIVTRAEVHDSDGRLLHSKGALGMVVETPADSTHSYRVQFPDGPVVSLTRQELTIPAGKLRHKDHLFEWSRNEFQAWATGVAERFGYTVTFQPVGEADPEVRAAIGVFTYDQ